MNKAVQMPFCNRESTCLTCFLRGQNFLDDSEYFYSISPRSRNLVFIALHVLKAVVTFHIPYKAEKDHSKISTN